MMKIADNTLFAVRTYVTNQLNDFYTAREVEIFFEMAVAQYLNLKRFEIQMNKNKRLSESELLLFIYMCKDLKKFKPIQYILGETEWFGLILKTDERALIPRPETEELCDWIIQNNKNKENLKVLDICTGSGCIALALKKHLKNATLSAWDVSDQALELAQLNAEKTQLEIEYSKVDVLNFTENVEYGMFDIIVSNPPYVLQTDKSEMHESVLNFEPHLALFVEDSKALIFYERIIQIAQKYLLSGGTLYFETHEAYTRNVKQLLEEKAFQNVEIKCDMQNKERMIYALKP